MDEESIPGKMAENMMENISLIKNMVTVSIIGLTAEGMKDIGNTVNNTAEENIICLTIL
jgi:hypothetical protein